MMKLQLHFSLTLFSSVNDPAVMKAFEKSINTTDKVILPEIALFDSRTFSSPCWLTSMGRLQEVWEWKWT
jgi:hypothetical protein